MTDTPQPTTAGETEVASNNAIADAANAFKTYTPDAPETERVRDEHGRFAKAEEPSDEIEAEDEAASADEPEAESHDDEEIDEAADEAQPEAIDLPPSWPAELAEEWSNLPAPLQEKIVQREAERETAVNAKFQEAANLRKAHEAEISEAQTNRQHFAEAADFVLSLARPQEPPVSMLNPHSSDYNPDEYHLRQAQFKEQSQLLSALYQQRQSVAQQEQAEQERAGEAFRASIEEKYGPLLLKDVPDLAVADKQASVLSEIARYAVDNGVPAEAFTDPNRAKTITSADLRIAWKAMQYDKMIEAKGKVQPKAAKPAAPPVRPGVATPKSAVQQTRRKANLDRLSRSGSIEDGAAVFKDIFRS